MKPNMKRRKRYIKLIHKKFKGLLASFFIKIIAITIQGMEKMKKLEKLLFKMFKALIYCYGKVEGCKLFSELLKNIKI